MEHLLGDVGRRLARFEHVRGRAVAPGTGGLGLAGDVEIVDDVGLHHAARGLVDQPGDLGAVDRLLLQQGPGHRLEAGAVLAQHLVGPLLLRPQDVLDLLVDHARGLVAVVP